MADLNYAVINDTLPKLIELGRDLTTSQALFLQEMNKVQTSHKVNPGGLYMPYITRKNNTAFGVAEGGPILGGAAPAYAMGNANIRAHWFSLSFTGDVARIADQYLTQFRTNPRFEGYTAPQLMAEAQNAAVKQHIKGTLEMAAVRDNYFALQGNDASAIGVVTGTPGGGVVEFSWDETDQGNRMFEVGQQIQFFSSAGVQRTAGLATGDSDEYSVVTAVDRSAASGATGPVTFGTAPTAGGGATQLHVGDIAVFRNSRGRLPMGFIEYVDDTGTINGITRSTAPEQFESVVQRLTGSPTIAIDHFRAQMSFMQSKMGYGVPFDIQIWMNKTLQYDFQSQVYQAPWVRQVGEGKMGTTDLAPPEMEWDGHKLRIDPAVPPSQVFFINFLTWTKLERTKLKPYLFNSHDYLVNQYDSFGHPLDVKQATLFEEYNWVCWDPRSNGRIEGAAFQKEHI